MAQIPPNQKIMLMGALSILSAALAQLSAHYNDQPHHQIHDLIENFNIGLQGFTQQIMSL